MTAVVSNLIVFSDSTDEASSFGRFGVHDLHKIVFPWEDFGYDSFSLDKGGADSFLLRERFPQF
jgi:hypothetical protein